MNLLAIVQEFCGRTSLPVPTYVIGNTDDQVVQLKGLVNEVMEDLVTRHAWQNCVKEATFTTQAQEDQGLITTIAPDGYLWILEDTIYNRSQQLPVFGPLGAANWQRRKAQAYAGAYSNYRIRGNRLILNPVPTAGHTCAFEYASSNCLLAADGTTYRSVFTADDDTFLLDHRLLLKGLRWKWKSEKGLDYSQEFDDYELLVNNMKGRDGTKAALSMDGGCRSASPGIIVPSGSWNL